MSGERESEFIKQVDEGHDEDRHSQDREAYVAALDGVKEAYVAAHKDDRSKEQWKAFREYLTIGLLIVTVILTAFTYWVFYQQLNVSRKAIRIAHQDADAALKKSHADAVDAIRQAQEGSSASLTKADVANGISLKARGDAQAATMEANRAWIDIPEFHVSTAFSQEMIGQNIRYEILERNFGRRPALDLQLLNLDNGYMPFNNDGNKMVPTKPYDRCEGIKDTNDAGGTVLFPSTSDTTKEVELTPGHKQEVPVAPFITRNSSDLGGTTLTKEAVAGTQIFYVRGCAVYHTMGLIGKTSFCHAFMVLRNSGRIYGYGSVTCPVGNAAK